MLAIVAEVDRAKRMGRGDQLIRCRLPGGDERECRIVCQVLAQVGLLERIGHSPLPSLSDAAEFDESVRHWRYATGTRVDEEPGDVLEAHEGRVAPALMTKINVGLTEALINSLHHAYRADRQDGCGPFRERRWWMFTHESDGKLNVLVCDLGIGIPRSLPYTWDRKLLRMLGTIFSTSPPDVASVRMALVLGESSTGEANRGKGLPQIWGATRLAAEGGVGILSGRAYIGYDSETGEDSETEFKTPLLGALVNWTISVSPADGLEWKND